MRSRLYGSVAIIACLVSVTLAPAQSRSPSVAQLGQKIPNLAFKDDKGQSRQLYDLKDKKAIVIVFMSFECPVAKSYCQPLADMATEYGKHGVSFIGLTINEDDTPADVAKHAKDFNLNFPVYRDAKLTAADALKADCTPEVFVLDGSYVLQYRGRIDNAYSDRLKKHAQVTKHDLRQALGELLSGRPVREQATQAVGCPIAREERATAKAGDVTYHRDVAPILQNNCQTCHRPGEVGPFALMNYKQAVNWAGDIKTYTQNRQMPPWKPVDSPAFHNERRLTQREIDTLAAWVDGGTPEGNPKDAPAPRKFLAGWQLGTPDLVLTVDEDFTLGPTGRDLFRCFVLPANVDKDQYVTAIEVRPSNPRVVHHVLLFVDSTGQGRKLEKKERDKKAVVDPDHPVNTAFDRGPGYTVSMGVGFVPQGGLSGWAPGQMPRYLPNDSGYFLPKGADVVMQVHYHRNGRTEKDRTQVGLYFSKKPAATKYQGGVLAGGAGQGAFRTFFSIPAGEEKFKLSGDAWARDDFTLYSIMPHMHMVGKAIKVTMTPPEGKPQTLVSIKEWDYNWQETYLFKEPIRVKAGTHFEVEALYDNSDKNPNNPFNPPRRVTFGEQTFNEMCFVFLGGIGDRPGQGGFSRGLPVSPLNPNKKVEPKTTGSE